MASAEIKAHTSRLDSGLMKKRGSSISQISKIVPTIDTHNIGFGGLLQVDYLSSGGKCVHLSKLLMLMFVPIFGGWAFTLYSLADNISQRNDVVSASDAMLKGVALGRLIYTIQKERENSILYTSKLGPGTKKFLLEQYDATDQSFTDMWNWPQEFASHEIAHFRTKKKLISYINIHRNQLDPNYSAIYDEIKFYSEIVDFLMEWLLDNIRETGFGNIWKSLVVFQKITRCMLDTGAERAYGIMFFIQGNFYDPKFYGFYFRQINRFNYNYRSSSYYSDLIDPLWDERTDQQNITRLIQGFRTIIKYSNFSGTYSSMSNAETYYDNISFRVDYLFLLQETIAEKVNNYINETILEITAQIIIYSTTAAIIIMACPVIVYFTEALTTNIQNYSKFLQKASDDFDKEQSKADNILYQMLPKTVVERLKRKSKVDSEYFKSATVMFTSIVNFTHLSIQYTPLDVVKLLNTLYTSIDQRIDKYDVYKVETINDTYMVVSGVPTPNGRRHAVEIAYLSLDILHMVKQEAYTPKLNIPIQLQIGASTGSVSAGIVGTVMLRYCLFGDTVNIASRMRSYCTPNRIHISESTYKNLKQTGTFHLKPRGSIEIKGKGEMNTFWLFDSFKNHDSDSNEGLTWRLPGEVERKSSCMMEGFDDQKPGTSKASVVTFEKGGYGTTSKRKQTNPRDRKESNVISSPHAVQKSVFEAEMWGYTDT